MHTYCDSFAHAVKQTTSPETIPTLSPTTEPGTEASYLGRGELLLTMHLGQTIYVHSSKHLKNDCILPGILFRITMCNYNCKVPQRDFLELSLHLR